jgi:deoxyribose-phosphate aldolase
MNIAPYIDHTLLKPDATAVDIQQLCAEAVAYHFAAVCIPPYYVQEAHHFLPQTEQRPLIATVIGFPMGYSTTPAKVEEIKRAIDDGADELDVVININAVKSKAWNYVRNDLDSMITTAHMKGKKIKVILETGLLDGPEIDQLCDLALVLKPDFLKTSTGFNGTGATPQAVQHLLSRVGSDISIKASGGIRTHEDARKYLDLGVQRIGASRSIALVTA